MSHTADPPSPFPFPPQRITKMIAPHTPPPHYVMPPPPKPVEVPLAQMRDEAKRLDARDDENRQRLDAIRRRCEQMAPGSGCGTA